jgi:hypothetical protein
LFFVVNADFVANWPCTTIYIKTLNCMQYDVRSVEQLGHGSMKELLERSREKEGRGATTVSACALACGADMGVRAAPVSVLQSPGPEQSSVVTAALASAPMLANLGQWWVSGFFYTMLPCW